MSIDPETLTKQQRFSVVRERPPETTCSKCGRRTKDRTGTCVTCRSASIPRLERLSVDQLTGLMEMCRMELKRRRSELDAALDKGNA